MALKTEKRYYTPQPRRRWNVLLFAAGYLLIGAVAPLHAQSWYDSAWSSRQQVTINSSHADFSGLSGDLYNFPYLITNPDADLFSVAQADGDDILFTASDGTTKLPHEIDVYEPGSSTLVAWVRLPVFDISADTTIYMYYGNPTVASQERPREVWDTDFGGVWHLEEDGTQSDYQDSTRNDFTGIGGLVSSSFAPAQSTNSISGFSQDFRADLSDDYIEIAGHLGEPQNVTISGWIDLDAADTGGSELFSIGDAVAVRIDDTASNTYGFYYDGTDWPVTSTPDLLAATGWRHVAYVIDDTADFQKMYIDGVERGATSNVGSISYTLGANTEIGRHGEADPTFDFDGRIDELRFSTVGRSADWLVTDAQTQAVSAQGAPTNVSGQAPTVDSSLFLKERGWQQEYYQYRRLVTINKNLVQGTHQDFPVLIDITLNPANVQSANGYDIVFTNQYEERLDHEIESYNNGTGELVAWVRIPTLTSLADTAIYVYYGNASVTTDPSVTGVWDGSFAMVQHMSEDPSGAAPQLLDGTANGNDGTSAGTMTTGDLVSAKIGNGIDLDGTDDYISVANDASLNATSELTLSTWVNLTDSSADQKIIGKAPLPATAGYVLGVQSGGLYPETWDSVGTHRTFTSGVVASGVWTHLALTWTTNGDMIGYINGVEVNRIAAGANDLGTTTNALVIGSVPWAPPALTVTGIVDEVRVSTTARSAGWIATEYNNQNDTSVGTTNFIKSVGTEEAITWWNSSWSYRKTLTLNADLVGVDNVPKSNGDLVNMPVLLSFTDTELAAGAQYLGGDIAFTLSGSVSQLDHELVSFNSTTGEIIAWVKIPAISSSSDTEIDIYYGNPNAFDQQNATGTWSNGFAGVWHLEESVRGAGGVYADSSGSGNDGTSGAVVVGGPPTQSTLAAGKIGRAQVFNGTDDAITMGDVIDYAIIDPMTYSAWIQTTTGGDQGIATKAIEGGPWQGIWFDLFNGAISLWFYDSTGNEKRLVSSDSTGNNGSWHQVVATYDGSNDVSGITLYMDGVQQGIGATNNQALGTVANNYPFTVGAANNGAAYFFNGTIDELRASSSERSADWILTEYLTQNAPGTYTAFSPPPTLWTWSFAGAATWSSAGNWTPASIPNATTTPVLISGTGGPQLSAAVDVQRLTIDSGNSLYLLGGSALAIADAASFQNLGTVYYSAAGASIDQTDTDSGTAVYNTSRTIQDYGAEDYFNLTIDGGAVTATLGADLTVNGDLTFLNGATLDLAGYTLTVAGDVTGAGTVSVGSGSLVVGGNLSVDNLSVTTGTVQLGGSFDIPTSFSAGSGTVELVDSSKPSRIFGSNTFNNLTIATPNKVVLFDNNNLYSQTVANLTVTGTAGNEVQLRSDSPGNTWDISATSAAVHYAYVQDSIAASNIDAVNSTNGGNNFGWTFNPNGVLDHFLISAIADQVENLSFSITITAKDAVSAGEDTVTGFTGTVTLSERTGTISPSTSPAFVAGVATFDVTIAVPETNVVITVTDGSVIGQSNSFAVTQYSPFQGLVGVWRFDDGTGSIASDSSGQGNDGTLVNSPVWTTSGAVADALTFDGSTNYVSVPDAATLDFGTADFTLAAWIKPATTVNGTYSIYSKGIGQVAGRGQVRLFVDSSDRIALQIEGTTGGQSAVYTTTTTIDDTAWHHVAVSAQRSGNATFVIDGGTPETVSIAGSAAYDASSTDNAYIATGPSAAADWFDGTIDEVFAYSTLLSVAEMQALYDDYRTQPPTLASPASSASGLADVDFTLAEDAATGTVKLTFARTGGTADANQPHVVTFNSNFESAGQHLTTLDWADLTNDVNVASVSSDPNDILVNNTIYDVTLEYQDSLGNPISSVTNTSFTFASDITPPTITGRETADLNADGSIDAVHISFDEPIDDTSVTATDFDVAGVAGEAFVFDTNGDTADDADIYITFTDGTLDTAQTPNLTYTLGTLTDLAGNPLASNGPTATTDTAGPVLISAASNQPVSGGNILSGTQITLTFSEPVEANSSPLLMGAGDFVVEPDGSASTGDLDGASASVALGAATTDLVVTLLSSTGGGSWTSAGEIDLDTFTHVFDNLGTPNAATGNGVLTEVPITGLAGVAILSRGTLDSDADGQIDGVLMTAAQSLNDDFSTFTVTVTGYTVSGYSTGATGNDALFIVQLVESDSSDTDARPDVQITANTSLADQATGTSLVPVDVSAVTPADTAGPVLVVASSNQVISSGNLTASTQITLTFSEAVNPASAPGSMNQTDFVVEPDGVTPVGDLDGATATAAYGVASTDIVVTLATATTGGTWTLDGEIDLDTFTHVFDNAAIPNAAVGNAALTEVPVGGLTSNPTSSTPTQMPSGVNNLQVTDLTGNGDRDGIMVAFFEIPDTVSSTLYFGVYDAAQGGSDDSGIGMITDFTLIGGAGALSGTQSRYVNFAAADPYADGTQLDQFTSSSGALNDWAYFAGVSPSQGEHIGNKYYFKIVTESPQAAATGNKNAFRLDVSTVGSGSPTSVTGAQSFAYSWTVAFLQNPTSVWNFYPFVPNNAQTTDYVIFYNFDADNDEIWEAYNASDTLVGDDQIHVGGFDNLFVGTVTDVWAHGAYQVGAASERNSTWRLTVTEDTVGPAQNTTELVHTLEAANPAQGTASPNTALRTYSAPYTPEPAYAVAVAADDGAAITGGTEPVSLQIVNDTGGPVPYVYNLYVTVDGSAQIVTANGVAVGAATAIVTTGPDGLANLTVGDAAQETVTVTVYWDGTGTSDSFGTGSFDTVSIDFQNNPIPVMSSASNVSFTEGSTGTHSVITISDSGAADLTSGNSIFIRIPASLTAQFNTGAAPVLGGTGVGNITGAGFADNQTYEMPITTNFTAGQTLTVTAVQYTATNSASSGSLEMGYNSALLGSTTFNVIDDKVVTVNPAVNTWTGATSNDWGTGTNWTGGVPVPGDDVVIPDVSPNSFPSLATYGAASVNSIGIAAGARLNTAGQALTTAADVAVTGTLDASGGGTITIGGSFNLSEVGDNFIQSTSTVVLNGAASSIDTTGEDGLFNLTVNKAAPADEVTMTSDLLVTGALVLTQGVLSLNNAALTVTGAGGITGAGTLLGTAGGVQETITTNGPFAPGILTANGASVVLNGGSGGNLGGLSFYDLTFSKAAAGTTMTSTGALSVSNALALSQGTWDASSFTHQITPDWIDPGAAFTLTANTSTIELNAAGAQALTTGGDSFNNLSITNGGTVTTADALTTTGNLTVTGGTLDTSGGLVTVGGAVNINGGTLDPGGSNLDVAGDFSLSLGAFIPGTTTTTVAGSWTVSGGTFTSTNSTVEMDSNGVNRTITTGAQAFNNLTISTGTDTTDVVGSLSVAGTLAVNANQTLEFAGNTVTVTTGTTNNGTIRLQGDETANFGAGLNASGLVQYYGTAATYTNIGTSTPAAYFDLAFDDGGASTGQWTLAAAIDVNGGLSIASGTVVDAGNAFTVAGDFTDAATYTQTGSLTFDGGGAAQNATFNAATTYADVRVGTGAVNASVTLLSNLTTGLLSFGTATTDLDITGRTVDVSGNLDLTNLNTFTATGSTVQLSGAGAQSLTSAGETFNDLTFTNTGTVSVLDATSVGSNLTFSKTGNSVDFAGTLAVAGNLVANAGAYSLQFRGATTDVTGTSVFSNTGTTAFGDGAGDILTFSGGVTATAGPKTIYGSVRTAGTALDLGTTAITLGSNATLDSTDGGGSPGGAAVTVGAVTGATFNLTIDAGTSGTVSGTTVSNVGTLTLANSGAGGVSFSGAVGVTTADLQNSGGTISFGGALTANSLTTAIQGYNIALLGDGTSITAAASLTNTGTVTFGDGADTIAFTGGLTATSPSSKVLGGVTLTAAGTAVINLGTTPVSVTATSTVGGSSTGQITLGAATISAGATLTLGAGVAAPVVTGTVAGTAPGPSDLTISTTGATSFGGTSGTDLGTITVNAASTVTMAAPVTAGALDISDAGASLVMNGNNLTLSDAVTVSGTLDASAGGNITVAGDWTVAPAGVFASGAGTVTFNASGADQAISPGGTDANHDFTTVVVASSGGYEAQLTGDSAITGSLQIAAGGVLRDNGTTISVSGDWTNAAGVGGYNATGTVQFVDNATATAITGTTTFNNVTVPVAAAGKSFTMGAGDTFTIAGVLTVSGAAGSLVSFTTDSVPTQWNLQVSAAAHAVTFVEVSYVDVIGANDLSVTASADAGNNDDAGGGGATPRIVFAPANFLWLGTTSSDWFTTTNWDLGYIPNPSDNVTITGTPPNHPVLTANVTVNNITVTGAANFLDVQGNDLAVNGTYASTGYLRLEGNTGQSVAGLGAPVPGLVIYDGAAAGSGREAGGSYTDLTYNGTGTWTLDGALNVDGAFNLTAGSLDDGGQTITAAGDVTVAGAFALGPTGTIVFDGTTNLTTNAATLANLQIGGAAAGGSLSVVDALTVNGAVSVTNFAATTWDLGAQVVTLNGNVNLTNLDTFTVAGATVIFNGTTTLTSAGNAFPAVQVGDGGGGETLALADALNVAGGFDLQSGAVTVAAGDLTVSTGNVTIDGAGGITGTGAGSLAIGAGDLLFAATATDSADVDFAGATGGLSVTGNVTHAVGSLADILVGSGNVVVTGNVTNRNDMTMSGGGTLSIGGTTSNAAGATISLDGISVFTGLVTNDGTITGGAGAVGINGGLTLAGTLNIASGVVTVTGNGTYTGATIDFNGVGAGILQLAGDADLSVATSIDPGADLATNDIIRFTGTNAVTFGGGATTVPTVDLAKGGGSVTLVADVTQLVGADLTFNNTAAVSLNLATYTWTFGGDFVLNDADSTVLSGTGTLAVGTYATTVSAGALTVEAGGSLSSTGLLTQSGAVITEDGDVTVASAALNAGTYDHNAGTLQTTGDIAFGGVAYDGTGAGNVTVGGSVTVTAGTVDLGGKSVSTAGASGLTVSAGTLDFGAATVAIGVNGSVDITGGTIELDSVAITTNNGAFSLAAAAVTSIAAAGNASIDTSTGGADITILDGITGSGALTLNAGAGTILLYGAQSFGGLTVTNAGLTRLAGSFVTAAADPGGLSVTSTAIHIGDPAAFTADTSANNGVIVMTGAVDVQSNSSLTAGTGGPAIQFVNTVVSTTAANLTLSAGGEIEFDSTVGGGGNDPGALAITTATNVTFFDTVGVGSLTQSAGSFTTRFYGDVTATGAGGVNVQTNVVQLRGVTVAATTGPITFTPTNDVLVDIGASTLQAAGNIAVNGDIDRAGAAFDLTLDSGGAVLVTGNIGAVNAIGNLTVPNAATTSVTVNGTVDAASFTIADGGAVDLNGAITMTTGAFSSGGTTFDSTGASITTTNQPVTINHSGGVIAGGGAGDTISTGTGAVDIDSTAGTVTVNAPIVVSTGAVTIDSAAGTTVAATGDITATGAASVTFGGTLAGTLLTAGDVSTVGGDVTFVRAVALAASILIDTGGAAAGNVVFSSTLDGSGAGGQTLGVTAGTGSLTFGGVVGGGPDPGAITVAGATGGVTANAAFTSASLSITNGGAVDLNGAVTMTTGAFSSTGTTFDSTGASITTTNQPVTINHTGNVIVGGGAGDAVSSGSGAVDIDATGGAATVVVSSPIGVTTGAVTIDSAAGTTMEVTADITAVAAANVTFGGTLAGTLTIRSDVSTAGGTVTFSRAVLIDGDLVVGAAAGAISLQDNLTRTAAGDDLTFTASGATTIGTAAQIGTALQPLNDVLIDGGGTLSIGSDIYAQSITVIDDATTLSAAVTLDALGAIAFVDSVAAGVPTIDGAGVDDLTLTAGTTVDVDGAIGAGTSIDSLTVTAGTTAELHDIGGGAAGVSGATAVSAANGITFTGTTYNANQQSYDAGAATNPLSFNALAPTTITSTGDTIDLNGEIILADGTNLLITSAGGNITFDEVEGTSSEDLTVNAGAGAIDGAGIGTGVVNGINTVALTAATTTITGDIVTSSAAGNSITVTGNLVLDGTTPTLDTAAGDSGVTVTGAILGPVGEPLAIVAGTGVGSDVNIGGSIGDAGATFTTIDISGNDITLNGIGTGGNDGATGAVTVVADNTGADARIILGGIEYRSGGPQSYTGANDWVALEGGVSVLFSASGGPPDIIFDEVYISVPTFTVNFLGRVQAGRMVLFNGDLNLNGYDLSLTGDLVAYGSGYTIGDDPERGPATDEWIYPQEADFTAMPWFAGVASPYTGAFAGAGLDTTVTAVVGNVITIGDDFYNNGANMNGAGPWRLALPALGRPDTTVASNDEAKWATAGSGGSYAVAFNMGVTNSTATSANAQQVSAGAPWTFAPPEDVYNRSNNNVTDGGGNSGWDFTVPRLVQTIADADFAKTRFDNVIEMIFTENVYNASGEIQNGLSTAGAPLTNDEVGQVWVQGLGTGLLMNDADADEFGTNLPNGNTSTVYLAATNAGAWDTALTWNTDADATGPGDTTGPVLSTNTRGNPRSYTLSLNFIKGVFTDAQSANYVPGYGSDGYSAYNEVVDRAPAALISVEAGRIDHNELAAGYTTADYTGFDGHNYFLLRYSEPVDLDGAAGDTVLNDLSDPGVNDGPGIADDDAQRRATTTVGAGDRGGFINGTGTVDVTGFFQYSGTLTGGSTDAAIVATSAVARKATDDGGNSLNTYEDQGVVIVVKGWSRDGGGYREWPGYIDPGASNPIGATVSVPSQAVRLASEDLAGNGILDADDPRFVAPPPIAALATTWDSEAPDIAPFKPYGNPSMYREIVTISNVGDPRAVDRIELHFFDDPTAQDAGWDSLTSHPDTPPPDRGVRDYTVAAAIAGGAFFLDFEFVEPPDLRPVPASAVFDTAVDNTFFTAVNDLDDDYVGFDYTETDREFRLEDNLWMYFTASPAATGATNIVTDLAGNRLATFAQYVAVERIPPTIAATLGIVGTSRVYVRFSERILGPIGTDLASAPDKSVFFDVYDAATGVQVASVTDITPLQTFDTAIAGVQSVLDAFLTLDSPITPDGALNWRLRPLPAGQRIEDEFAAVIQDTEVNRISDVALGVVQPVAAWNEIQRDDLYGDEFEGLLDATEFDGSGTLLAGRDTTVQAAIVDAVNSGRPVELYYDVDPDPSVVTNTARPETPNEYWLPVETQIVDDPETGETETLPPNLEARRLVPVDVNGLVSEFLIPGDDSEITADSTVEIILTVDGVPAARYTDPTDPRTVAPWFIPYRLFVEQRSGVTILNNVIYPADGDITVLDYELQSAGFVTINVLSLDGTRVNTLLRGRQTAGRYQASWDGTNSAGQTVASGLYFIRIVAPGIDEIRKVLVAK